MHTSRRSREIIWRRVKDDLSFEQARLIQSKTGWEISGSVLIAQNGEPLRVDYSILCDASWQTRAVHVEQSWRGAHQRLRLTHDGNGRWRKNQVEDKALDGCADVDLGVTPSTNAIPINRLRLQQGAAREIKAAWVRFPELEVIPASQQYHRVAQTQYEYKSLDGGFTALIDVDDAGLPVEYAGVWRRVAEGAVSAKPLLSGFGEFSGSTL